MRWLMLTMLLGALAGCGNEQLETGYVPRKLGDREVVRRGYYAAPFTAAAKAAAAQQDQETQQEARHQRAY